MLVYAVCGVAAARNASAACRLKPGFDVTGHDIGNVPAASAAACCAACAAHDGCKAGTWQKPQQTCYFKSDATPSPSGSDLTLTIPGDQPPPGPSPTPPPSPPPSPPAGDACGGQYAAWSLWPQPGSCEWTSDGSQVTATLPATFGITCAVTGSTKAAACPSELAAAIARYHGIVFHAGDPVSGARFTPVELAAFTTSRGPGAAARRRTPHGPSVATADAGTATRSPAAASVAARQADLTELHIEVSDPTADLGIGVDESYTLDISVPRATVVAKTQWGAMRALETFSQSVYCRSAAAAAAAAVAAASDAAGAGAQCIYAVANVPIHIADAPRFAWRGLMLDTSRHFIPLPAVRRTIDGMSFNKLNVLHWHATDDNSWSLQSGKYPNFTARHVTRTCCCSSSSSSCSPERASCLAGPRSLLARASLQWGGLCACGCVRARAGRPRIRGV